MPADIHVSTRHGLIGRIHFQDPLLVGVVLAKGMCQKSCVCVSLAPKAFKGQCASSMS